MHADLRAHPQARSADLRLDGLEREGAGNGAVHKGHPRAGESSTARHGSATADLRTKRSSAERSACGRFVYSSNDMLSSVTLHECPKPLRTAERGGQPRRQGLWLGALVASDRGSVERTKSLPSEGRRVSVRAPLPPLSQRWRRQRRASGFCQSVWSCSGVLPSARGVATGGTELGVEGGEESSAHIPLAVAWRHSFECRIHCCWGRWKWGTKARAPAPGTDPPGRLSIRLAVPSRHHGGCARRGKGGRRQREQVEGDPITRALQMEAGKGVHDSGEDDEEAQHEAQSQAHRPRQWCRPTA